MRPRTQHGTRVINVDRVITNARTQHTHGVVCMRHRKIMYGTNSAFYSFRRSYVCICSLVRLVVRPESSDTCSEATMKRVKMTCVIVLSCFQCFHCTLPIFLYARCSIPVHRMPAQCSNVSVASHTTYSNLKMNTVRSFVRSMAWLGSFMSESMVLWRIIIIIIVNKRPSLHDDDRTWNTR